MVRLERERKSDQAQLDARRGWSAHEMSIRSSKTRTHQSLKCCDSLAAFPAQSSPYTQIPQDCRPALRSLATVRRGNCSVQNAQKIDLSSSRYPQGLDAVTVLRERCSATPASLKQAYTHRDPSLPDRRPSLVTDGHRAS